MVTNHYNYIDEEGNLITVYNAPFSSNIDNNAISYLNITNLNLDIIQEYLNINQRNVVDYKDYL